MPLIEARGLIRHFVSGPWRRRCVRAVDDVSFGIGRGETLGLVGESGCGKTTLGRLVMRLIEPTAGKVVFEGTDLTRLGRRGMRPYRPRMQMIFQGPEASLNPRMRIGDCIAEPLRLGLAGTMGRDEVCDRVSRLMERVGLNPEHESRYPRQMSGGQNQRAAIARVLAIRPSFIVADEPTASLDVSVQAQILYLLMDLKKEYGLTMLFISHDMAVVRHMCDRVAVMYGGKIVEIGDVRDVYERPLHPYTKTMISAAPMAATDDIAVDRPGPGGCVYCGRCPESTGRCRLACGGMIDAGRGHRVLCHRLAIEPLIREG